MVFSLSPLYGFCFHTMELSHIKQFRFKKVENSVIHTTVDLVRKWCGRQSCGAHNTAALLRNHYMSRRTPNQNSYMHLIKIPMYALLQYIHTLKA